MARAKRNTTSKRSRESRRNAPQEKEVLSQFEAELEYQQNRIRFGKLQPRNASQAELLRLLDSKRLVFALGPAGTGKAQPLDAKIKTPEGWKTMGEILPGDIITSADGTETKVLQIHPQGIKPIYRITFQDGRSTECCAEHLWNVYCYEWGRDGAPSTRTLTLGDIMKLREKSSYKRRLYVDLIKPEEGVDNELPIDPYLLGALLGDGYFGHGVIGFTTTYPFIENKIKSLLPPDVELVSRQFPDFRIVKNTRKKNGPFGQFNSMLLALKDLNLLGKLSSQKSIPDIYLTGSRNQRLRILQGLLDTDGEVDKSGSVCFSSTSLALASQVIYLVRSLGGIAKIAERQTYYTHKGQKKAGQVSYRVNIRYKNPRELFTFPDKLSRLPENYQYAECLRLRITNIEYIGEKEAQCISIDHPSKLYVTDDFIVTHNTFLLASYAAEALLNDEIDQIIITRPQVDCDEEMGFLPGDEAEKFASWIGPFMDVLEGKLGKGRVASLMKFGQIQARPLGKMRGSTFRRSIVILDEAQNTTRGQMKMFLTRIGEGSKVFINGDMEQSDLPGHVTSGLVEACDILRNGNNIGIHHFTESDVVRDPLVKEILKAYRAKYVGLKQVA